MQLRAWMVLALVASCAVCVLSQPDEQHPADFVEGRQQASEYDLDRDVVEHEREAELEYMRDRAARRREKMDRKHSKARRTSMLDEDPYMRNMPFALEDGPAKEEAFANADTNKDGKVSEEEFRVFVMQPLKDDHLRQLEMYKIGFPDGGVGRRRRGELDRMDPDEEMSKEEEAREIERYKKRYEERVAKMSAESKKKLDEKAEKYEQRWEKRRVRDEDRQRKHIDRLFPRLDRDNDGSLSADEWHKS